MAFGETRLIPPVPGKHANSKPVALPIELFFSASCNGLLLTSFSFRYRLIVRKCTQSCRHMQFRSLPDCLYHVTGNELTHRHTDTPDYLMPTFAHAHRGIIELIVHGHRVHPEISCMGKHSKFGYSAHANSENILDNQPEITLPVSPGHACAFNGDCNARYWNPKTTSNPTGF